MHNLSNMGRYFLKLTLYTQEGNSGISREDLRAFLAVAAEKKRLPAMITDSLVNFTLEVSAFTVRLKYTGLEVLLQPVRIRQWIPDYVDVNWLRQVESAGKNSLASDVSWESGSRSF